MEIKRVWDIIVRRKWVIIQGFVVIFGIIAIATFLKPKTYLAECKCLIESEGSQEALLRSMGLEEVVRCCYRSTSIRCPASWKWRP